MGLGPARISLSRIEPAGIFFEKKTAITRDALVIKKIDHNLRVNQWRLDEAASTRTYDKLVLFRIYA